MFTSTPVAEDASVVHQDVKVAKGIERRLISAWPPFHSATLSALATASPPMALISSTTLLRGGAVIPGAVHSPAEVIDDHAGSFGGEKQARAPGRDPVPAPVMR